MKRDVICLMCPNGCHLTAEVITDGTLQVSGHRCEKGLVFARAVIQTASPGVGIKVVSAQGMLNYGDGALKDITEWWGISFCRTHPHIIPAGSPERSVFRIVIEAEDKRLFILEQIPPVAFHAKMKIIKSLEFLAGKGLCRIFPYMANAQGEFIQKYGETLWQAVPFCPGVSLDRTRYMHEKWRGAVLSDFLIQLKEKSVGIPFFEFDDVFSLKKYVYHLWEQINRRQPQLVGEVRKTLTFLERDFMEAHDTLPTKFCHGDYHPLNIVWGRDDANAVIDWEFLGFKPEIYDLANMVGCLGMEHPSSLTGPLVLDLIGRLKDAGIYSASSWACFLEFVIAMRFAWLSEWLRKDDAEMIALELDYMELLANNREDLSRAWMASTGP